MNAVSRRNTQNSKRWNFSSHGSFYFVELAYILVRASLIPLFLREVVQRRKVTIVLYHNLEPVTADRHFSLLKDKYNIISLRDFLDARKSGKMEKLPPKSLIITFDDGLKLNYKLLPIFRKYGITPTIFLCSGITGTKRHFWFKDTRGKLDNEKIKKVPNEERLKALEKIGFEEEHDYVSRQALSDNEIEEMKENVDFQSHTVFHPCLPRCSPERARYEIANSRQELANRYGLSITALSYPNGDYTPETIRIAREEGYECGITVDLGYNDQNTDLFRLRRIGLRDHEGPNELIVRVTGLFDWLKQIITPKSYGYMKDN